MTLVSLIIGLLGGLGAANSVFKKRRLAAKKEASGVLMDAKKQAEKTKERQLEHLAARRQRLEEMIKEKKEQLGILEKRVSLREKHADKWDNKLQEVNKTAELAKSELQSIQQQQEELLVEELNILFKKTNTSRETVMETIRTDLIQKFQLDYENYLQKSETVMRERATKFSKGILQTIMNRYTEPSSVDRLDNTVTLSRDIVKGKLIGKMGRNINYFEKKAGVAVLFNEGGPLTVTVSCFHLLRREIAKRALQRLAKENVINEEVMDAALEKSRLELDVELEKVGLWAAKIIELPEDKRDPELLKLMGRLKYRTSYGQNILYHSLEIAFFSAMMAAEIGADVRIAKLGGFFHDLGKAIDQDDGVDKPHDHLSKDILEQFGFEWEIVHAAWTHHDAIPIETIEAEIVKASDAISAGRPGARAESTEDYYARISALEAIATSHAGVQKVFAVSAGRELRTMVNPQQISDADMLPLAEQIKGEIEENVSFPGKIKVHLIRSLKATDYAKEKAA